MVAPRTTGIRVTGVAFTEADRVGAESGIACDRLMAIAGAKRPN
jgi:hypothetical protein